MSVDTRFDRIASLEMNHKRYLDAISDIRKCANMLEPLASCVSLPELEEPTKDANQTV